MKNKNVIREYYASLTDEELELAYNQILDQQIALATQYYYAKEQKIHRQYIKNKQEEKKKVKKQ